MDNINLKDLHLLCRACLLPSTNSNLISIYELSHSIFSIFKQSTLYKKKENSLYPKNLCKNCYEQIKAFEEFRLMSTKSAQKLAHLFNKRKSVSISIESVIDGEIKTEIDENNDQNEQSTNENYDKDNIFSNSVQVSSKNIFFKQNSAQESTVVSTQDTKFSEEILVKPITTDVESKKPNDIKNFPTNDILEGATEAFKNKFKVECKYCHKEYDSTKALEKHKCSNESVRPYPCQICVRSFGNSYRLVKHIEEDHGSSPTEIICKFEGCGKVFRYQATATSHYRLKHNPSIIINEPIDKTCVCEICGRKFQSLGNLRRHRYQHQPIESRPFHCNECGKRFVTKNAYKEHLLRHAGIKNFTCPYCGLKKTNSNELKRHINFHTKEKQWYCPSCPKVFNRASALTMHDNVVHKGIRKFACKYCDLSFGKPDTLKNHERRHTGEKPYKCKICDRPFIQAVALKTHMKTHNKSKEIQ